MSANVKPNEQEKYTRLEAMSEEVLSFIDSLTARYGRSPDALQDAGTAFAFGAKSAWIGAVGPKQAAAMFARLIGDLQNTPDERTAAGTC